MHPRTPGPPAREITIGRALRDTVSRYPDRETLVYPDTGLRQSYREFAAERAKVAKGFMAIGVGKGDHIQFPLFHCFGCVTHPYRGDTDQSSRFCVLQPVARAAVAGKSILVLSQPV